MSKRVLWICYHYTHRYEEVNLLLDAGHEVIPIIDPPNEVPGLNWKKNNTLPEQALQAIRKIDLSIHFEHMRFNRRLTPRDKKLINQHIDIIMIASFIPEVAEFLKWFNGKVVFRAFGHGNLNSYTAICHSFKLNLDVFKNNNYIWCPISSSLDKAESAKITRNMVVVVPAVSRQRLSKWHAKKSKKIVCNTISRIQTVNYYKQVYTAYVKKYGSLPLMILGKNKKSSDPRIVGNLNHKAYYDKMASARVVLYQTDNPYHLHYHPIEALAMGVPTLYHQNSMLAYFAKEAGVPAPGMYSTQAQALNLARQCLNDIDFAIELSKRQRIFPNKLISRERALEALKKL